MQRVHVFVRVRPNTSDNSSDSWAHDAKTVSDEDRTYLFDRVIDRACVNEQVAQICNVPELMRDFSMGTNISILLYGQTNSGKTHTMFGSPRDSRGIIHHCLDHIFSLIDSKTDFVTLSLLEIYNEEVRDLLVGKVEQNPLRILFDQKSDNFIVDGLLEAKIRDLPAAMSTLRFGLESCSVGTSHLNDRSSRAHTIFRLRLEREIEGGTTHISSELNLVDLAGSESLSDLSNRKETAAINLSLSHLKRAIVELSHRRSFVQYRNSALTKLLKGTLQGNSKTLIICTVAFGEDFHRETKATLMFGTMAKSIQTVTKANISMVASTENMIALQEENRALRARLAQLESVQDESRSEAAADPNAKQTKPGSHVLPVDESSFEEFLIAERHLSALFARTLEFLQNGCSVQVYASMAPMPSSGLPLVTVSSQRLSFNVREQSLKLFQIRGGEIVCDGGRLSLDQVTKILLGKRYVHGDADSSSDTPKTITLMLRRSRTTVSPTAFAFQCFSECDFEAWVVCLSRVVPAAAVVWDSHVLRQMSKAKIDPRIAPKLSEKDVAFCRTNNIAFEDFLDAKQFALARRPISVMQLRMHTALLLFEGDALCRYLHGEGLLRQRIVLSSS
jgi:centromeric protein E